MPQTPDHILRETFGLESFREGQREIIDAAIAGKNVLVLMPTGGGKSLTYQIPALCREGIALIISPLISLMKDQADRLNSLGIRAEIINSTKSAQEIADILEDLRWSGSPQPPSSRGETSESEWGEIPTNPIRFVYIAPERLRSRAFMECLLGGRGSSQKRRDWHEG